MRSHTRRPRALVALLALAVGLLIATQRTSHTRADTPTDTPAVAVGAELNVTVSGHVVDDGRCMDQLFGAEAQATQPHGVTYMESDDGGRVLYSNLAPTQPAALLAWAASFVMRGRTLVAVPLTLERERIGWRIFCVVTRPLLPAAELTLAAPTPETNAAGVTRTWRALTISATGQRELELTLGRDVIFLDPAGGFHGLRSVTRLLDTELDEVFF